MVSNYHLKCFEAIVKQLDLRLLLGHRRLHRGHVSLGLQELFVFFHAMAKVLEYLLLKLDKVREYILKQVSHNVSVYKGIAVATRRLLLLLSAIHAALM